MNNAIIFVGDDLRINKPFMEYLKRTIINHLDELWPIEYIKDHNSELPFLIEKFTKSHDNLLILANKDYFHAIGKIISTLSSDVFELKNETLMPSRVENYAKNSFCIKLNKANVNLVNISQLEEIPKILLQNKPTTANFLLLGIDIQSAKLFLEPIAKSYKIDLCMSKIVNNLITLKATKRKFGDLVGFLEDTKNLFPSKIIINKNLNEFLANTLIKAKKSISFAESCTSGLCANELGKIAGVSEIFAGSMVTYSNQIKHNWLGVSNEILETNGAVSKECVEQMCIGSLKMANSDFSIAISGIAGPSGGSEEKPVGTVFVGVASKEKIITQRLNLKGDRNYIQTQSMLNAFVILLTNFATELEL